VRKDWDSYFIDFAKMVASRATCTRGSVGAVFVRDRRILATGYNGSVSGTEHCADFPDEVHVVNGHCDIVIHAEINAIIQAAKGGVALEGATLYCTHLPCWLCAKSVLNLGIKAIVYDREYRPDFRVPEYCAKKRVHLVPINPTSQ
jgi:dCMP deaminase